MRRKGISAYPAVVLLILGLVVGASSTAQAEFTSYRNLNPIQKRHVSGLLSTVLNGEDEANRVRAVAEAKAVPADSPTAYQPGPHGCANRFGRNVKVNQNCLNLSDPDLQGRGQAQNETWIAANPRDGSHVVASYNDYRRGDGSCGVSYSLDGGRTFADSTVPNGFARGDFANAAREYWQGGGDTSMAWDTRGNVYLSCLTFNRGAAVSPNPDQSSALYVFRSGNNGASFNFPGRAVAEHNDTAGAGNFLLDKQFMTVDSTVGSPFQDRVYVTWTTFDMDGTAYIHGAFSADYGQSFSPPVLISRNSALCDNALGLPTPQGTCNTNQFSQPFTGSDGALYVTWSNYNNAVTGTENRNQILLAKSTDGGQSFAAPVRVGHFYELPDCATYQNGKDPFRACVPEKGTSTNSFFRAANYPIGVVSPRDRNTVVVTFGSYVNRNSNEANDCKPTGFSPTTLINTYDGVKNGGCNNDILLSVSTNGGSSFTGTTTDPRLLTSVTNAPDQRVSSQFWQGATFTSRGTLAVMSYDRQYGADETTGFSDITVSSSRNLTAFKQDRATSSSMPPPTQFSGTFWGDYAAITTVGDTALPLWSDTRPLNLFTCPGSGTPGNPPRVCAGGADNASFANDQDIYITAVNIG